MKYYLGIDSGGTLLKAGLYDEKGRQLALCRQSTQVINERAGWVERDLSLYWQETCSVIQGVVRQSGIAPRDICGVSISAQGKGVCLLDQYQQPLRNGILSSDSRAIEIVRAWQQQQLPEALYPLTRQTLWTGHPVSLLRWLKEHEPETYRNIGSILMFHDFLRYCMTGDISAELTNISESNFFNANTQEYDPQLLALCGIEEMLPALPKIVPPTALCGYIHATAAAACGLVEGTPVFAGLFDVVSTALCSGISVNDHKLNVVMGTWSVTSGITETLCDQQQEAFIYGCYVNPQHYIVHEASPTSASNYEWFAPWLGCDGKLQHADNEALVRALPPLDSDILFVPFLYGSNAGLGLKSGLYGVQAHHKKAHIIQAIWEGILYCHTVHIEKMLKRFPQTQALRVTGGSTQSMTWMQILADLTGLRVEIPALDETGTLGAAVVAMVGDGIYPSVESALGQISPGVDTILPDSQRTGAYQQKYRRYRAFVELLKQFEAAP
ncbi:MAG: FGGY-family carbohydrate kinase [Enterobacteriaceae bacterium]